MTDSRVDFNEIHWRMRPRSGVTRDLARNVSRFEYGDIPPTVIVLAKRVLLDAIGCMLAGSLREASRKLLRFVRGQGGVRECAVVQYGDRTNRYNASLLNGAFCGGWGLEDTTERAVSCGNTVVPAALAVAEKEMREGNRVLTAVALGCETVHRIAAAATCIPTTRPLHPVATFGPFGAAVASGKLLGFQESDMENTLSLCPDQAAGTLQAAGSGTDLETVQGGVASSYGVRCAYLAGEGLSGARQILEGNMGFFQCVCGLDSDRCTALYDVEAVNRDFGRQWLMENITFRVHPVGFAQLRLIEAVALLREREGISAEDVRKCVVSSRSPLRYHARAAKGASAKTSTLLNRASTAWDLGMTMVVGGNRLADYRANVPPHGRSKEIAAFGAKVAIDEDRGLEDGLPLGSVRLELKDGRAVEAEVAWPKGDNLRNPLTQDELLDKFREQASLSHVTERNQERVISIVDEMEDVDDLSELMTILCNGGMNR
jgi:2-methylcitrate dehydratase PrpD